MIDRKVTNCREKVHKEIYNKEIDKNKITLIDNDLRKLLHQVKNPITVMKLILQDEDEIDRNEMSLELLKIEAYLDMLLPIVQIHSNNTFELNNASLDEIIRQIIRKFSLKFQHKNLKVNYLSPDFYVNTNEKLLIAAISQLIDNAIKFTARGTISIYPGSYEDYNTIIIEDTGRGIEENRIKDIFAQNSSCMGLYLSRSLLEIMSCKITITSSLEVGTKVTIYFPR